MKTVVKLKITLPRRDDLEFLIGRYEVLHWAKEGPTTVKLINMKNGEKINWYSQVITLESVYLEIAA